MYIFILIGILIHLLFLISIFDVYFTSSISNIDIVYEPEFSPPAKRLVVFISDGLSAYSLYNFIDDFTIDHSKPCQNHTPFINSIIEEHGSWGISVAGVPTETRPGHVAIMSGIHEDPSAVFSGWGEFPVDFDSIINESKQTFGWGDEYILSTFSKAKSNYTTYVLPIKDNYENKASYLQDSWVFNNFLSFFNDSANHTKETLLWHEKTVYLLCLPSLDETGHSQKPNSKKFEETIGHLDNGLRSITTYVDDYYNDNQTSYMLTSDHGMTLWGSHGSGSRRETQTPLLLWGAGIAKNKYEPVLVNQTDLAVLLATLLGTPIPKHSLGVLSDNVLEMREDDIFQAYSANIKQLLEYYWTKENEKKNFLGFRPFEPLSNSTLNKKLDIVNELRKNCSYEEATIKQKHTINEILAGINYCQNYYRLFLQIMVTISMITWILTTIGVIIMYQSKDTKNLIKVTKTTYLIISPFPILFVVCATLILISGMDYVFLIYASIPIALICVVLLQHKIWSYKIRQVMQSPQRKKIEIFLCLIICLLFLELLVLSFFIRQVLTLITLAIGVWMDIKSQQAAICYRFRVQWIGNICILAGFPLLPAIDNQAKLFFLFYIGNAFWISFVFYISFQDILQKKKWYQEFFIFKIQFILLILTILLSVIVRTLDLEQKFTGFTKVLSWILFGISLLIPFFTPLLIPIRIMTSTFSFLISYIMLSVAYEPLFFLILTFTLITWLKIEYNIHEKSMDIDHNMCKNLFNFGFLSGRTAEKRAFDISTAANDEERNIDKEDLRRAIFCICFFILSMFGTGNTSDINSFDPNWTKLLVTELSFFLMSALVLWKIIIPVLFVSLIYTALNILLQARIFQLLLIITTCSDLMAINFFYLVRNQGSWLEIGLSISHYIIIESMILSVVILLFVSKLFLKCSFLNFIKKVIK